MTVSRILRHKGVDGVITVTPDTGVIEIARVLAEHGIGTVVVSSDGRTPEGILSERDIVRAISRRGAKCLEETASAMMTANPQTCVAEDRADEVLTRMTEGRFRHLPVLKDGALCGMISLGDVVKARLDDAEAERGALEDMVAGR